MTAPVILSSISHHPQIDISADGSIRRLRLPFKRGGVGAKVDGPRKVMVISDSPLFREGLARVLGETDKYTLVGAAASVDEAVEAAKDAPPDVIVFDGAGPEPDERDLTALLRLGPSQLVTLSLSDPDMTVMSRKQVAKASVEDLLAAVESAGR